MYKSHCMCGDFRYSTDINDVYRWREKHKEDCYYEPNIQYPNDD
jgi:hypothetical protein